MTSPSRSSLNLDNGGSKVPDPGSQAGSAAGSLQGVDGALSAPSPPGGAAASGGEDDSAYGFQRSDFGKGTLVGTVQRYDHHLFLCYRSPEVWPSHVEGPESDSLPKLLSATIKKLEPQIDKKIRLTICEGVDGTEFSNGDLLIFPDMIRFRQVTPSDVEHFVDEVPKMPQKNTGYPPFTPESLSGSYIFVCAHGSRDKRCGVCGPVLIKQFKEEISSRGLNGQVFVSPCSHIGGHKYAGNVIIFSKNVSGEVTGHWYGYVAPDDVPVLLEQHIGKGEVVDHLWRGQMGLSKDEQKATQSFRLQLNGELDQNCTNSVTSAAGGCCQGAGNATCCQVAPKMEKLENNGAREQEAEGIVQESSDRDNKGNCIRAGPRKLCSMSTWFELDACVPVVAAIASVAVAYVWFKRGR